MGAANDDTITQTHKKTTHVVKTLTASWSSDSGDGSVDGALEAIDGLVYRIVTNPGATAPTADYDVYLNDVDGYDILAAGGVDRHTSTTECVILDPPVAVSGVLTLDINSAGNSKIGTVVIYYI